MDSTIVISSDENDDVITPKPKRKSTNKDNSSVVFIPDGDYGDDVMFVEPEDYSPKKKLRLEEEKRTAELKANEHVDSEVAVTFDRKGIEFPHAREHCRINSFKKITPNLKATVQSESSNDKYCEKCYCFVCDELSSKCESWNVGENPHCNGFAKNAYWEKERKMHKRKLNMKNNEYVSILSSLPSISNSLIGQLRNAEKSAQHFRLSVDEIDSNLFSTSTSTRGSNCSCLCHHRMGILTAMNGNCEACLWAHTTQAYFEDTYYGKRYIEGRLRACCNEAVALANRYLSSKKPSCAIVVLDLVTISLLSLDMPDLTHRIDSSNVLSFSLTQCWIEACIDSRVDKTLVAKAKERIQKAASCEHKLFLAQARSLNKLIKDMKPMDDPVVQKCLKGQSSMTECADIAKARLHFLKKSNRFKEAINFILGVKVINAIGESSIQSYSAYKWCDNSAPRKDLVEFLVIVGRLQEAMNVLIFPYQKALPSNLMSIKHDGKKSSHETFHNTVIQSIPFTILKRLITGLMYASTPEASPGDKLLKAAGLVLPALFVNNSFLTTIEAFVFYFEKFCSIMYKDFVYPSPDTAEAVQKSVMSLFRNKIKLCKRLAIQDLKPPKECNIPFQVYVIEVIATAAAMKCSLFNVMTRLVKKELYWVCISLLTNDDLQYKVFGDEIKMFTKTILPKTGTTAISLDTLEKWYKKVQNLCYFDPLFQLASSILDEGKAMASGPMAVPTRKKAVVLSQKLTELVMVNSSGIGQSVIHKYLQRIDTKFSNEAAAHGINLKCADQELDMKYLNEPSFENLELIRKSFKDEAAWLVKREVLLQYLDKNASKFQEAALEIYTKLEMFERLKTSLSNRHDTNYEKSVATILSILKGSLFRGNIPKRKSFFDSTVAFIANSLVYGSFNPWVFKAAASPINETVKETVKTVHRLCPDSFKTLMTRAMSVVCEMFLNHTVHQHKKLELEQWLVQIKGIFVAVNEAKEWTRQFDALQRNLKRKPQLVTYLNHRLQ